MAMRTRLVAALASMALLAGAVAPSAAQPALSGPGQQPRFQGEQAPPGRVDLDALAARFERMGRPLWVPAEVVVEFRPRVAPRRAENVIRGRGLQLARRMPLSGLHVARVPSGRPVGRVAAQLKAHPAVRDAEPNFLRYPTSQFVPNDPLFDQQWGLLNIGQAHGTSQFGGTFTGTEGADIKATEAWDVTTGDPGDGGEVVVAVVDTGVDVTHPDIAANLWVNRNEFPNGKDEDGNGYVDDIHGCDFTKPVWAPAARCQSLFDDRPDVFGFDHGTHVAGTIAAVTDNDEGVAGVCPECKIMVLKIGRPFQIGGERFMGLTLDAQIEALDYAAHNGADIVNASFGIPVLWSGIERRAYQRLQRAGVLSVIAAGNERGDNDTLLAEDYTNNGEPDALSPIYPASYDLPGIISVAATNSRDEFGFVSNCPAPTAQRWRCAFTNWGFRSVHVAAPGVDIVSAVPTEAEPDYAFFDGTSMAAPHVAGVAGLVKAANPSWGRGQIKRAILNSVESPLGLRTLRAFPTGGGFPPMPPIVSCIPTNGRVNAHAAVTRAADDDPGPGLATRRHDNIARARWIPDTRRGRLMWPHNSNHVYKKRLVRGARYRVRLQGPPGQDFNLWLWRPFTRDIWQIEEGCIGGPGRCAIFQVRDEPGRSFARITFRAPASRVFYIHVSAFLFSGGNYTLRAWRCTRPAPRC
jgi:subtilisin family serine protease